MATLKKKEMAIVGQFVTFTRKGICLHGVVVEKRTETVVVEIPYESAKTLDLSSNFTVVNHKNYTVIEHE